MKKIITKSLTCFTLALTLLLTCIPSITASATETSDSLKGNYVYNFSCSLPNGYKKYDLCIKSDYPCVGVARYGQKYVKNVKTGTVNYSNGYSIYFYTLNDNGELTDVLPYIIKEYEFNNNTWVVKKSYEYGAEKLQYSTGSFFPSNSYYFESKGSGLRFINYANNEVVYNPDKDTYSSKTIGADNIRYYLATGKLQEIPKDTEAYALTNTAKLVTGGCNALVKWFSYDNGISLSNVKISEDGYISWNDPLITHTCVYKGVAVAYFVKNAKYPEIWYRTVPMDKTLRVNLPLGCEIERIILTPYYITTTGRFVYAKTNTSIYMDASASYYQNDGTKPLFSVGSEKIEAGVDLKEDIDNDADSKGDEMAYEGKDIPSSTDNYITVNGVYSENIPTPKIITTDNAYKFHFDNAHDDYYMEVQGRWYSVDNIYIYKDGLTWKYKYHKVLQNGLSTWVGHADKKTSHGEYDFSILGNKSFKNLLSTYPIKNRNYYGSQDDMQNYFNGYSDAKEMLTEVFLPYCTSAYNGCEVYVRYYKIKDNGSFEYGKWCHWYDNLASISGSSGSAWDDKENIYGETQSVGGLTEDDKQYIESTGNSKENDTDGHSSINAIGGTWETDSAESLWGTVDSMTGMLGDFPSMFAEIFSFMPPWVISLIAVGIGALVILRFLGR